MKNLHVFTRSVMLLMCILLLGACASTPPQAARKSTAVPTASTAIPIPSPTPSPTLTPPPLGPVPQDCPPGPTPRQIFADLGPGVGSFPVWAFGFGGPHATIQFSPLITYTQYGWPEKILWRASTRYTQPITLHGGNLRTGTPLWFQIDVQDPSTAPVLDPRPKEQQVAQIAESGYPYAPEGVDWASYVYIPMAGCYYIEANWPGGSWRITFAAGVLNVPKQ